MGEQRRGPDDDPGGLSNVVAIAAGGYHSLALLATEPGVAGPVIINSPFALAGLNSAFQYRIRVKNGATSYGAAGLPGLGIDAATGLISGTPTVYGTFTVTLSATNASGTCQSTLTLTINHLIGDTDGDGIPDWWTQLYFGHPTGLESDHSRAEDDPDGDGYSNAQEFLAGTNPTNSGSVFRILSVTQEGDDMRVIWTTAAANQRGASHRRRRGRRLYHQFHRHQWADHHPGQR